MGERIPIQFGTKFAVHRSKMLSPETAENLYLEKAPEGAKTPYILLNTPGLVTHCTLPEGPIRGLDFFKSTVFAVAGEGIYRVDALGGYEFLGHIPAGSLVSMAHNHEEDPLLGTPGHIWVATGGPLFAVNENGIINVTNGDFASSVTAQDSYLIYISVGTQIMGISALGDALTIDPADYTTVDATPGVCIACISGHRELYVLKEDSIEVFYNSGAAAFPFARTQVIECGCRAVNSVAKALSQILFLGADGQVYSLAGYQPSVISTPAVELAISAENSPQTAVGYTYQQGGHTFYVLSFAGITLCYDLTTGLWHRRKSFGMERHRINAHTFAHSWRKNIVGDSVNGKLYALSLDTYKEGTETLVRRAVGTPVFNRGNRFIVNEFFLDIEAGVTTVPGADPQIALDWSDDGGRTYSSELWRTFGMVGEYTKRVSWRNLGAHHNWVPRITISADAPVRIAGAFADITPLVV